MPSELARSSAHGTLFHVLLRLSVRSGTTPALPLVVECPHLSPLPREPTYPHCVQVSEFSACRSHREVWPTEKSGHSSPGMLGSPRKFIPSQVCLPRVGA